MKYIFKTKFAEDFDKNGKEIEIIKSVTKDNSMYLIAFKDTKETKIVYDNEIEECEEEQTRTCSECGKPMKNGYVIENGMEYYCSDKCLHKNMTQEEYLELYDDGNGDSYWTEWED